MQILPKINPIRSWNPKRRKRAFIFLLLSKRRRKRAAEHGEEELSAPNAPSGLGIGIFPAEFFLTWTDPSNNADGFRLYRSAFGDPFEVAAEIVFDPESAGSYEFHDSAVEMGVSYTYYVVAFNAAGESAQSNAVEGELSGE